MHQRGFERIAVPYDIERDDTPPACSTLQLLSRSLLAQARTCVGVAGAGLARREVAVCERVDMAAVLPAAVGSDGGLRLVGEGREVFRGAAASLELHPRSARARVERGAAPAVSCPWPGC